MNIVLWLGLTIRKSFCKSSLPLSLTSIIVKLGNTVCELKAIADRYEMGIIREEITGEGIGLYLVTEKDIPELDTLASTSPFEKPENVITTKEYSPCDNTHTYRVYCPANWFDLWGWRDE